MLRCDAKTMSETCGPSGPTLYFLLAIEPVLYAQTVWHRHVLRFRVAYMVALEGSM